MKAILILSLIAVSTFARADIGFDFLACIKDGEKIVGDVTTFVNDVKGKKDISGIIADLQVIVNDIPQFMKDCEISDVEKTETLEGDFSFCIKDIETLYTDATKLIADAKAKDISSLINDVVVFYDNVKQTLEDCSFGDQFDLAQVIEVVGADEGFNPIECLKDAIQVVTDVTTFINDVNAKKDIPSIIADLEAAVNDIQKALPDCGAGDALSQVVEVTDIGSCLKDIQQAVQVAEQIQADIKNKDISSFINDAVALINVAK